MLNEMVRSNWMVGMNKWMRTSFSQHKPNRQTLPVCCHATTMATELWTKSLSRPRNPKFFPPAVVVIIRHHISGTITSCLSELTPHHYKLFSPKVGSKETVDSIGFLSGRKKPGLDVKLVDQGRFAGGFIGGEPEYTGFVSKMTWHSGAAFAEGF